MTKTYRTSTDGTKHQLAKYEQQLAIEEAALEIAQNLTSINHRYETNVKEGFDPVRRRTTYKMASVLLEPGQTFKYSPEDKHEFEGVFVTDHLYNGGRTVFTFKEQKAKKIKVIESNIVYCKETIAFLKQKIAEWREDL